MSYSIRLLLPALLVLLTACQSSKVTIDYDTEADFSQFRTYDWLLETSGAEEGMDPLIVERTKNAIISELKKTPLVKVKEDKKADVLVRYYVATHTQNKESKSSGSVGMGSSGRSSGMGVSLSFPIGGNSVVKENQIIIDMVLPETLLLKWRGTNRISIGAESPEEIDLMINDAVAEIFSRFPPEEER